MIFRKQFEVEQSVCTKELKCQSENLRSSDQKNLDDFFKIGDDPLNS